MRILLKLMLTLTWHHFANEFYYNIINLANIHINTLIHGFKAINYKIPLTEWNACGFSFTSAPHPRYYPRD